MKESEKGLGHKSPRSLKEGLPAALERLAQLYEAWDKPDEASKWRKDLEAQRQAAATTVKPRDK